jgi:hypothetical protein
MRIKTVWAVLAVGVCWVFALSAAVGAAAFFYVDRMKTPQTPAFDHLECLIA